MLELRVGSDAHPTLGLAGHELSPAARLGYADEQRGSSWWIPVAALGVASMTGGAIFLPRVAESNRYSE